MKSKIAGLILWEVAVKQRSLINRSCTQTTRLFITTKTEQASVALEKTEKFLARNTDEYPDASINGCNKMGDIVA